MDIGKLIGETTDYDKKVAVEVRKPKSWCKSVCAFANGDGGSLLFGIADDGEIVGLVEPERDAETISEIIKTKIDPTPDFNLQFQTTDNGKVIVVLEVRKGDETPYYYSDSGALETFVRIGNESVKASAVELKRLVLRGKNSSYDSQLSTYKLADFAFTKLTSRYKRWTGIDFTDKDFLSFDLADNAGHLTNAGILLADNSPIRHSRLFCTRWNGLDKSGGAIDAFDDAEYSGSLISLIEEGEAFIKRNTRTMWRKTPNSREEMPEYVERSYHEALVNGLVHRDYLINGSEVHIDIFDNRMEIYSPGGMPDGSIIQDRDPLTVPSTRRNPVLADIFNRLGYMERKGSGFGKIIHSYEQQVNFDSGKQPFFRSDRYQFTVVMPNLNYGLAMSEDIVENEEESVVESGQKTTLKNGQKNIAENVENEEVTKGADSDQTNLKTSLKTNLKTSLKTSLKTTQKIIDIMKSNPYVTIEDLCKECGLTRGGLKWNIQKMKEQNIIRRVGPKKGGYWEIIDNK